MKNSQIPIRVSLEMKMILKEKAAQLNMTLSQYMLHVAFHHQTKILSEGPEILEKLSAIQDRLNSLVCISPEDEKRIQSDLKRLVCHAKEKL